MKIGIMGGTFDPIHFGHLMMAEQAREAKSLDQVWFIPAGNPPHKKGKEITDATHRMTMVKLAIEDNPAFSALDWELRQSGYSYTVFTIKALKDQFPDAHFSLILGTDMVNSLSTWYRIDELLELTEVIAIGRPGFPTEKLPEWIQKKVNWVPDVVQIELSATEIRQRLVEGRSVRYLIPEKVISYIREKQLYGVRKDYPSCEGRTT